MMVSAVEKSQTLHKIVKLGTVKVRTSYGSLVDAPVYCEITVSPENGLSIRAVEGPLGNGNALGSAGQLVQSYITDGGASITPGEGWDAESIARFVATWARWHLNRRRAGAPDQEIFVRAHHTEIEAIAQRTTRGSRYDTVCMALALAGLLTSKSGALITVLGGNSPQLAYGYRYGSGWVCEDLPADVFAYLESLPATTDTPAWV